MMYRWERSEFYVPNGIFFVYEKYFQFSGIFCIYLARYIIEGGVLTAPSIIFKKIIQKNS